MQGRWKKRKKRNSHTHAKKIHPTHKHTQDGEVTYETGRTPTTLAMRVHVIPTPQQTATRFPMTDEE